MKTRTQRDQQNKKLVFALSAFSNEGELELHFSQTHTYREWKASQCGPHSLENLIGQP